MAKIKVFGFFGPANPEIDDLSEEEVGSRADRLSINGHKKKT